MLILRRPLWLVQNVRMDLELETEKTSRMEREMGDIAGATKDDSEVGQWGWASFNSKLYLWT